MGTYGTLAVLDDLATVNETVAGFGEAELAARFAQALAVHNAVFADMVSDLATPTAAYLLPYGGGDTAIIDELDEFGAADASKPAIAGNVGLPLRNYEGTLQTTRTWMETNSVAKLASKVDAFATADVKNFQRVIKRAFFKSTNTTGYIDRRQSGLTYDLKALLNSDGQAIPDGPGGVTFDGSNHTHYVGTSTLTAASQLALINNVVEHGVDGDLRLYIARGNEAAFRLLTGFTAYVDARITVGSATAVGNVALDTSNITDRAIGVFEGAEVWVKPWVPTDYQVAIDVGAGQKPLGARTRTGDFTGTGAFQIRAEHEHYPLRAQHMGREFGIGVVGRHKAAVNYSANSTYAIPTFT